MGTTAAVAIAGALGAASRYGLDRWIETRTESLFPLATFAINVSGCLVSALLIAVVVERLAAPNWLGVALTVGFVGAYTTFSTFAVEIYELTFDMRRLALAAAYLLSSATAGVAAVALGMWLGPR